MRLLVIVVVGAAAVLAACGGDGDEEATGTPRPDAGAGATATRTPAPTPTPAPAPATQPEWSLALEAGDPETSVVLRDGTSETLVAKVTPEQAQFEPWDIAFEADLDGDGVNEAIVSHYSGGAHCCLDYSLFVSADDGIVRLDAFGLGNAGIEGVSDLDGDGIPEIKTYDDRLSYFVDIPYAASPSLPLVLCQLPDATYSDCTPDFPASLEGAAQEFKDRLADAVQRGAGREETHGIALGLAASYVRIGMPEEGRNQVAELCDECRTWLLDNWSELEVRLRAPIPYRE